MRVWWDPLTLTEAKALLRLVCVTSEPARLGHSVSRLEGQQMNTLRFSLRVLSVVTVLTASLICVLLAKPKQADVICGDVMMENYSWCLNQTNPDGSYVYTVDQCQNKAGALYFECMRTKKPSKTMQGGSPTPPPLPNIHRPPRPVGNQPLPSQSLPQLGTKPVHPVTGPITTKSPSPSPTVSFFAKPQSTPPPKH